MNFDGLIGQIISDAKVAKDKSEIVFTLSDGSKYRMFHSQDCCESVEIDDICGDWKDIIGNVVLNAEEVVHENVQPLNIAEKDNEGSFTWTFYKIQTMKGSMTIRWYGSSNGYYSEAVDFQKIE